MPFWAYMLHCRGGKFYTGHTDDLDRRIAQHKSGVVTGFTSDKLPVELVWSQKFPTRYEALSAERQIKGWSRAKKLALIRGDWDAVARHAKAKDGPSTGSGRTEIEVAREALTAMRAAASAAHPREACGLLLGDGARITAACETTNVHGAPTTHFEIDPQALIDAHRAARSEGAPQVIGYFHSHPVGDPVPSATDRACAAKDGRIWAIVAPGIAGDDVRFWMDAERGFTALSFSVIES